jgi:hemerythrin superfamily protein
MHAMRGGWRTGSNCSKACRTHFAAKHTCALGTGLAVCGHPQPPQPESTMATTSSSRAVSTARNEILDQLMEDHKRVRKAYREFQKLDIDQDSEQCEEIVRQVLRDLMVHAALEEEFLYPAARDAIDDDLLDEAEVEHESMHTMIEQLSQMTADDDKYAARFTVLCEYVMHHVKEEEGEMFPQLQRAKLDWEALAQEMKDRRLGLEQEDEDGAEADEIDTESGPVESGPTAQPGGTERPRRGKGTSAATAGGSSGGRREPMPADER